MLDNNFNTKTGFWHFPKSFYAVLFIEFWERFAFYGIQSVAVIYFIHKFGIKEVDANNLFASFPALLYAMLTVGGAIGDKILGICRTYLLGIIFLIIGYGVLSVSPDIFQMYLGMGIILVGNVLFKTNANNYVSRCFPPSDPRLDSAFTYFYMSINIGSFCSTILVPIIAKAIGYSIGLGLCSIGMIVSLISFFCFYNRFSVLDNEVGKNTKNLWQRTFLVVILASLMAWLFIKEFVFK